MTSSTFTNSDFVGLPMPEYPNPMQVQMQNLAMQLHKTQVRLAEVSSKYENVLNIMSERQYKFREDIASIRDSIDAMNDRISQLEKFIWKLFGGLAILVFASPLIFQYVLKGI